MIIQKTFSKKIIAMLFVALLSLGNIQKISATVFADENLRYEIVYHWGIIWKHAATASLSIRSVGTNYKAALCAQTVSWADKVYRVRDTLSCTISKNGLRPQRYVKAAHEGKHFGVDIVDYDYSGTMTTGKCTRIRKDSPIQKVSLQAHGPAYDMLSVFYLLRTLDFDSLSRNKVYRTTVFSGKKKERIDIKYAGIEDIKLRDDSKHKAYHIKFTFTQDGQTKSSDDMGTWISIDERRIPLMLRGKLPIGEVRCYYAK